MTIDLLRESDLSGARPELVEGACPEPVDGALRLSTQAGWNQLDADWRRMLHLWPHGCFAGRIDGKLIATATLATYGAALGWVGMVLVDQDHRGQGYGGQILDAVLHAAKEAGVQTVGLDATDLGRPVYLKRGFRDVAGIDRWVLAPTDQAKESFQDRRGMGVPPMSSAGKHGRAARATNIETGSEESIDSADNLREEAHPAPWREVIRLDQSATGIDRTSLLENLWNEAGTHVHVRTFAPGGKLAAYGFHRPGRLASHLGPVVAESESDAAEVLDALLERPEARARPVLIDVPRGRLGKWLADCGFTCQRRLTRMIAGHSEPDLLDPRIFAAFGFELG